MPEPMEVEWTERSLKNAKSIRRYLQKQFTSNEVDAFEKLLESFERIVVRFPTLYPQSQKYPELRRAVLHKFTTVFYMTEKSKIYVIAVQDNRQDKPGE